MAETKQTAKPSTKAKAAAAADTKKTTKKAAKPAAAEKKETAAAKKAGAAPKKAAVKKTAAPKAEAKTAAKTAESAEKPKKATVKKAAAKKSTAKKAASKPAAKASAKTTAKPAAKKTPKKEKLQQYESFRLDSSIAMMQAMGVPYTYDDYARELMKEADLKQIAKHIIEAFALKKDQFQYEEDGYDLDLIPVVLEKIAETVDFKASDYPNMEAAAKKLVTYQFSEDAEKNSEAYLTEFHLLERLLMIAQRQDLRSSEALRQVINVDMMPLTAHFMQLARQVLASWQYDDVRYYENFAYALLSQFEDLFAAYNRDLLMDAADLYILHEDYPHGDEDYGYIIRDNQIKDYVYYRFAHVYEDIDLDKAKAIVYESLQYVDSRYDYYQPLIDILNR